MSSGAYNSGKALLVGTCPWVTGDIRVLLTTEDYVPDVDHASVADVTADELSGGNYSRRALAGKTATADMALDRAALDASDTVFVALEAIAGTPRYAVLYYEGDGTDAGRPLIAWVDIGSAPDPTGSDYRLQWAATGLGRVV